MSTELDLRRLAHGDHPACDHPTARRVTALLTRRAAYASGALPLIPGWVSESTLAVGEEAHLVRVHRLGDAERRPYVAKVLRALGPEGEPRDAEEQRWRLLREVVALRALGEAGCPSIPRVVTFRVGSGTAPWPWYVMPYYAGGAMWREDGGGQWAEPYSGNIDRVLEIAEALANTLAFMHEGARPCVHGQVVASNVLLERPGGRAVLADFGNARLDGYALGPDAPDLAGEWPWRPPELGRGDVRAAVPASDVFMLGGLIYEALSGGRLLPPASRWPASTVHERPEYSLRRYTDDPRVGAVSALLGRMLTARPKHRLSARQVTRACRAIRRGESVGGHALLRALPGAPPSIEPGQSPLTSRPISHSRSER